ncbi:DUF3859 domain-containing protein [Mesobacterium sp. TK19101]|uniref:DUF3859 domain-containing protein n=1 Tax=Mesobacterium hydrothermale TaxID=3111907 RepID=A0ABU6HGC2_9RHOB|nr:DUF3859 domain-containing protein [Mesobacterium sp. TK19101]MEC3861510.1 DUF3859 domain-containing protein [Mesobacterium sp. TK19101]
MRRAALTLLLASLGTTGAGQSVSDSPVALVDYGIFCPFEHTGESRPAPDTENGQVFLVDHAREVDIRGDTVPAILGFAFGIRYRLEPGVNLPPTRVIVTHPPLGAAGMTRQSWDFRPNPGDIAVSLFSFDMPYEMVPGDWSFLLTDGTRTYLERRFRVVPGDQMPWVFDLCQGPAPMS